MAFFQGAKNVHINGGEFTQVQGNYTVFDQSRHTSNVNSFNTTNKTTVGSHNDNSSRYYGANPSDIPPHRVPGQDQTSSATNGGPGVGGQYLNGPYAFPPPTVHPALMIPPVLPPGSRIQNFDSFNVQNGNIDNAYNNNSKEYGAPPPKTRLRPDWRHRRGPQTGPQDAQGFWNEEEDHAFSTSGNSPSGIPADPGKHSPPSDPRYANNQFGQYDGGSGYNQRGAASSRRPPYIHTPASSRSNVQHTAGQVQHMSPDLQQSFAAMMQHVKQQTAPHPADAMNGEEEESSEDSSPDEDEVNAPQRRPLDPLYNGMANLSLDDASTRPAFSRVKSDPQMPTYPSISETLSREIPHHSESAPSVPQHLKDPIIIGAPPSDANPYGSPTYPQQSTPLQAPNPADLSAFGLGATSPQLQGAPIFRNIHGDYTKVDNSVHATNLGSGNTHNTLIKDSYNDNSFKSYAPAPPPKPRKQGRMPF